MFINMEETEGSGYIELQYINKKHSILPKSCLKTLVVEKIHHCL